MEAVEYKDICPHCGGTRTVKACQQGHAAVYKSFLNTKKLNHIICLDCGTVIRSYIDRPEDWA